MYLFENTVFGFQNTVGLYTKFFDFFVKVMLANGAEYRNNLLSSGNNLRYLKRIIQCFYKFQTIFFFCCKRCNKSYSRSFFIYSFPNIR